MILEFASVSDVFKGTEPSSFRNSVFLKGTEANNLFIWQR